MPVVLATSMPDAILFILVQAQVVAHASQAAGITSSANTWDRYGIQARETQSSVQLGAVLHSVVQLCWLLGMLRCSVPGYA